MNPFAQLARNLGPIRLVAMGLVAIGIVGFFILMTSRLGSPGMTLLYGDLALEDSNRIVTRLDALGVPYELRADGQQVLVPRDQVARLRMTMAGEGLPRGGSVGYEIFDQAAAFGTTGFVQRLNLVRALEGELARTISAISQVQAARVHLVLPTRDLFAREKEAPSASIVLKLRTAALDPSQVLAIQHLVASAVPGLTPGRISVVDDRGTLLARSGNAAGDQAAGARTIEELDRTFEARLARSIESLLERTVGPGRIRAEVAAELNFDRVTTQNERYDPDGQVVRSTAVEEQAQQAQEAGPDGQVTVANNLPQGNQGAAGANQTNSRSTVTRETTNFEISRTIETHVREGGKINRLSVAVLVDGARDANGAYTPRPQAELDRIGDLVRSAIGFKQERGDVVQVVNLQFAPVEAVVTEDAAIYFLGLDKTDLLRVAEIGVLGIVGVLALLLVVRPIVGRLLEAMPAPAPALADGLLPAEGPAAQLVPPPGGAPVAAAQPAAPQKNQIEEMMSVAKVEGQVRAGSVKRITEIVQQHPEETVSILRNWMVQDR